MEKECFELDVDEMGNPFLKFAYTDDPQFVQGKLIKLFVERVKLRGVKIEIIPIQGYNIIQFKPNSANG